MALNQPARAAREFEALIALQPGNLAARHQLASYYAATHQPNRAKIQLRAILKISVNDAGALFSLAHLVAAERSFSEARDLLKRAYAVAPQQPEIIDSYACLSYLLKDLATAQSVVKEGGPYYEGNAEYEQRRQAILAVK